ncbi:MAG: ABC-type lipopolysaccharide export system ATPase subunit [Sulfurimonas sp.]|jgi:ABC-type lipopolysaccharide export system ATPase subunit
MLENIALIKEVHNNLATPIAQKEAGEYLDKLGLLDISLNRINQCNSMDIFHVCLIRALMTKETNIIIVTPFHLIDNLRDISTLVSSIETLDIKKNILIIDTISNKTHYKGSSCNIVE